MTIREEITGVKDKLLEDLRLLSLECEKEFPSNSNLVDIFHRIKIHSSNAGLLSAVFGVKKRSSVCLCNGIGCNSCEPQGRG